MFGILINTQVNGINCAIGDDDNVATTMNTDYCAQLMLRETTCGPDNTSISRYVEDGKGGCSKIRTKPSRMSKDT
ncbi:hypothetical protein M514_13707 [Trichuris suis]|uniref:Uncharacterized protein n=1 Tax=Trichuris suis TaxID=68888 RepID=A0A085LKC1_9BILA|nr:hypothetical protein M513_13707 [Trichuris suis]KFD67527.1 hypothetical protein M514_13707 [Trichuris suis]